MFTQQLSEFLARKPVVIQLLRFACIGALNTALDFLILNLITEGLGIQAGFSLAAINVVGVVAAVVQSYYWNKHWTFGDSTTVSLVRQFVSLLLVGGLGFVAFVCAVWPSISELLASRGLGVPVLAGGVFYYGIVLLLFLLVQIVIGVHLGFRAQPGQPAGSATVEFGKFVLVSILGVLINSVVLTVLVAVFTAVDPSLAGGLAKNMAKFIAVFVSLVWNFVGYKFLVFRR